MAQVQGTMEDHPVQFVLKGDIPIQGIFLNAIDTDIYLTGDHPAVSCRKGEGQNIGKIVMIQKTSVQIEEVIVVTENVREFSQPMFFMIKKGKNKRLQPFSIGQAARGYEMEIDPGFYMLHGIS